MCTTDVARINYKQLYGTHRVQTKARFPLAELTGRQQWKRAPVNTARVDGQWKPVTHQLG